MFLTMLFVGGAIVLAVCIERFIKRIKHLRGRNKRLEEELSYMRCEIIHKDSHIKEIKTENASLKHLLTAGCRNIQVQHHLLPKVIEPYSGVVSVIGVDSREKNLFFVIKSFPYSASDPDGYEFAMNEAYELVDKLKE